ncbi:hypothetical protein GOBAR_DD00127 [Gossypium barbadense]|nr:hypothetical protein GOBAR_DD00127 [Gossypium barbadense]
MNEEAKVENNDMAFSAAVLSMTAQLSPLFPAPFLHSFTPTVAPSFSTSASLSMAATDYAEEEGDERATRPERSED